MTKKRPRCVIESDSEDEFDTTGILNVDLLATPSVPLRAENVLEYDESAQFVYPGDHLENAQELEPDDDDVAFIDDRPIEEAPRRVVRRVRNPHPIVASTSNLSASEQRKQRVSFCFTYNNPTETPSEMESLLAHDDVVYYIFQKELGASGTLHYQGYIHMKKKHRTSWMCNTFFKCHWEWARGSPEDNQKYCSKPDTRVSGPWTSGRLPKGRGERKDLEMCKDMLDDGATMADLFAALPQVAFKYQKGIQVYRNLKKPKRDKTFKVRCELHYGPTRSGKTYHCVYENGTEHDPWRPMISKDLWFDGYDMDKAVLFDDFGGAKSHVALTHLLNILDNYVIQVAVKGMSCWFAPDMVLLTSNTHPSSWYKYEGREEEQRALAARFDQVSIYTKQGVAPTVITDRIKIQEWFIPEFDGVNPHFT